MELSPLQIINVFYTLVLKSDLTIDKEYGKGFFINSFDNLPSSYRPDLQISPLEEH